MFKVLLDLQLCWKGLKDMPPAVGMYVHMYVLTYYICLGFSQELGHWIFVIFCMKLHRKTWSTQIFREKSGFPEIWGKK